MVWILGQCDLDKSDLDIHDRKDQLKEVTVSWSSWGLEGTDENLANN